MRGLPDDCAQKALCSVVAAASSPLDPDQRGRLQVRSTSAVDAVSGCAYKSDSTERQSALTLLKAPPPDACNGGMRRAYVATRIAPGDVAERLKAAVC
jgi:hypothetical protein